MMPVPMLLLAAQTAVPAPVLMMPPPAPPAAVVQRQAITTPVPRQPLLSLFFYADYPSALSRRVGRRGVVGLKLLVDPQGRIETCGISGSSGEPMLDMATCNTLRRRAHFTPATDASGNPASGTVDVVIDWDAIFRKFGQR